MSGALSFCDGLDYWFFLEGGIFFFFFFYKVEDRVIGIVSIRVMSLLWVCRVVCEGAVACLCGYD